jgi:hypothetical protein
MAGGTVTAAGGNIIHTFTSSGYLTPIVLVNNSLRFRLSGPAKLTRTPTVSSSTLTKITYSAWIKRGKLGTYQSIYGGYIPTGPTNDCVRFTSSDTIDFNIAGGAVGYIGTTQVFRDPSAWYHIVAVVDTTQANSADRMKLWINGVQVNQAPSPSPSQNYNLTGWNNAGRIQNIGTDTDGSSFPFDGYMAEVYSIDGQALTPSSFGAFNGQGVWQPVRYGGSYGTNGFYLPFNNNSSGASLSASYLMVAGGGAGGAAGGGGGAGGLLTGTTTLNSNSSYIVTVGNGGSGGSGVGARGGDTSFIGLTATGGGGGAYGTSGISATTGGSGGGGSVNAVTGAAGTSGQGFAGGNGINTDSYAGGGGGGASAVGSNASTVAGGNGGAGTASSITGSSVTYAGGGGGGGYNGSTAGTGGAGGGGNGASSGAGASGTANRGGGGGGGANGGNGGSGGSGVVIVSYSGGQRYTGGTVTSSGGNTIHTFTSSDVLTSIFNDQSPQGNNWTPNNFNVSTLGSTYDSMTDVPTLTSATTANYAVFNPLNIDPAASGVPTLTNGNLTATGGNQVLGFATMAITTGKFYWEYTVLGVPTTPTMHLGITTSPFVGSYLRAYRYDTGDYFNGTAWIAYGATWTTNDVIGVALDMTNQTIEFFKNNTSQGQKTSIGLTGQTMFPFIYINSSPGSVAINLGQQGFKYTPPTGFVALNTFNLPTPTIGATPATTANKYFDATLYTGTTAYPQAITNAASFKPDFVWAKSRSNAQYNGLFDSVRSGYALYSNATDAEDTTEQLTFNSNGFSTPNKAADFINTNGYTYVAWQWRASNATAVTNTAGSITSTVSANTTAGFSIVTYTGTGSIATIGHGLGVAPAFMVIKARNAAQGWLVYHQSIGNTGFVYLNDTAAANYSINGWNNTSPTSTVFTTGVNGYTNQSGQTQVAYCFAEIAGYSKFGSFIANASADGPFIYTGFRPAFVIFKKSSGVGDWITLDNKRDTYNVETNFLLPNSANAEASTQPRCDFLSNGIKVRAPSGYTPNETNGDTYIYMAFAESPFKYANAR